MLLAVLLWRQHPAAIEADLADRGHDIFDWHSGKMSSRKLLVLLEHAPETGPYKTALRDGNWPEWVKILANIHKELALYRAAKYVGGPNEYIPNVFLDPIERVDRFNEAQQEQQELESSDLFSDLYD